MREQKYHLLRKRQADLRALLRGAVSLYLICLGYQLAFHGGGDMSRGLQLLLGGLFALGGAAFGLYAHRQYQSDRRAARLTDQERQEALRQEAAEREEAP